MQPGLYVGVLPGPGLCLGLSAGAVSKRGLFIRLAPLDELVVCVVLPVGLALATDLAAGAVANGVIGVVFFCLWCREKRMPRLLRSSPYVLR